MKPYRIHPQDPGPAVLSDQHYLDVIKAMNARVARNRHDYLAMEILLEAGRILRGRILTRLYGEYDPDKFPEEGN